ncbi:MAG TPA: ATP-binding protein [Telluria sp.]|nr:ATP-binding protein [Telluria sp.]
MIDAAQSLADNDRYLGEAVGWVRSRLEQMVPAPLPVAVVAPAGSPAPGMWRRRAPGPDKLLAAPATVSEPVLPARPASLAEAEQGATPPALALLSRRLALSPFEQSVLLLCAAMEFDTAIAELCGKAQHNPNRNYPTFGLAMALFDDPAWDALSPQRPLRYWRLLEIRQPPGVPLIGATLGADERIVNYLKGLNYLDDRLASSLLPEPDAAEPLPPSQQMVADSIAAAIIATEGASCLPAVQLLGHDSASKRAIAGQAARALGCELYLLDGDSLPHQSADLENFARLWQRESLLSPLALYLDGDDLDAGQGGEARRAAFNRLLGRTGGLAFLATREPWPRLARAALNVETAKPLVREQQLAWQAVLAEPEAGADAATLAGHFNLNLTDIRQIAAQAGGKTLAPLWDSVLLHARPALDQLAQRIDAIAGWDELRLPAAEKALLRQLAEQVSLRSAVYDDWGFRARMNRGLGISALFAGDSGTGKTMAAEVIARELNLLMYRIDLSAVVSKFIGETEKNLRKLFDAAEDSGAILFFDEADALFGKRSEVKDSHDRYANIEVNYLLQRMESYRGLAILATNRKSALDAAFLRRLRFIINFPFPAPAQRQDIWTNMFPPQTPLGDIDWQRLARFNLSGGSIHNITLNAAFLAAGAGQPVGMAVLLEAVRNELRKLEKPINEADFAGMPA